MSRTNPKEEHGNPKQILDSILDAPIQSDWSSPRRNWNRIPMWEGGFLEPGRPDIADQPTEKLHIPDRNDYC